MTIRDGLVILNKKGQVFTLKQVHTHLYSMIVLNGRVPLSLQYTSNQLYNILKEDSGFWVEIPDDNYLMRLLL